MKKKKRQIITEVMPCMFNIEKMSEAVSKLLNLLLEDTCGGKLYKYRCFDKKNYSLNSLTSGTLYCSCVNCLNDPFEFNIGITFNTLYSASEKKKLLKKIPEIILLNKVIKSVIDGNIKIEDCDKKIQKIIKFIFRDEEFVNLFNDLKLIKQKDKMSRKEIRIFLSKHYRSMFRIIEIILSEYGLGDLMYDIDENIINTELNKIIKFQKKYGKNLKLFENIITEEDVEVLSQEIIDVFLAPDINKESVGWMTNMKNHINEHLANSFFVGCLTTKYNNNLMWAHYADSHKGFCVEYDFSHLNELFFPFYILPVLYDNKRIQFPQYKIDESKKESELMACKSFLLGMTTKDKAWEYENEWRILVPSSIGHEINMPPISCIYLGAKIENKNKRKILKIARERGIPVKQMKIYDSVYGLKEEDVFVP